MGTRVYVTTPIKTGDAQSPHTPEGKRKICEGAMLNVKLFVGTFNRFNRIIHNSCIPQLDAWLLLAQNHCCYWVYFVSVVAIGEKQEQGQEELGIAAEAAPAAGEGGKDATLAIDGSASVVFDAEAVAVAVIADGGDVLRGCLVGGLR